MVFFTFAQAASKFIVLILPSQRIFYLQTRTVRHNEIRSLSKCGAAEARMGAPDNLVQGSPELKSMRCPRRQGSTVVPTPGRQEACGQLLTAGTLRTCCLVKRTVLVFGEGHQSTMRGDEWGNRIPSTKQRT